MVNNRRYEEDPRYARRIDEERAISGEAKRPRKNFRGMRANEEYRKNRNIPEGMSIGEWQNQHPVTRIKPIGKRAHSRSDDKV